MTLDGKGRIIEELRPLVKAAASPLQRSLMLSHFSETIGIPAEELGTALVVPTPHTALSEPVVSRRPPQERLVPLSLAQKSMVSFMILYPHFFPKLETNGLRAFLQGTVGEILFLKLKSLLENNAHVESEELLDGLPEGDERRLVADILLDSSSESSGLQFQGTEDELADLFYKLKKDRLEKKVKELEGKIAVCSQEDNGADLLKILCELKEVNRQRQSIRPKVLD